MKRQKSILFLISSLIYLMSMQIAFAENDFYSTDYGAMAYVIIPFGGGDANTSPILGFTGSKVEFNELHVALGNRGSDDEPFIYKRNLIDIMYNWEDQRLSRFNLGGVNALDSGILNVDGTGGGIKPVAALIGVGLAVGGIVVASESSDSDNNNHACEEEHHDEEEGHAFAFNEFDITYSFHPCPEEEEEEEGGHGH